MKGLLDPDVRTLSPQHTPTSTFPLYFRLRISDHTNHLLSNFLTADCGGVKFPSAYTVTILLTFTLHVCTVIHCQNLLRFFKA